MYVILSPLHTFLKMSFFIYLILLLVRVKSVWIAVVLYRHMVALFPSLYIELDFSNKVEH